MIVGPWYHPVLKILDESPWRATLVGSRFVGVFDRDKSDYDFIVECDAGDWYKSKVGLKDWLVENGFVPNGTGYGPDGRLLGDGHVWTHASECHVPVDVIPMPPKEAARRLKFFEALKAQGDKRGGLLALALKREKQWATLWECLAAYNE